MVDRNLEDAGAENRMKGTAKNLEGKFNEAVGDLTDDKSQELKGKAQQLKGKLQDNVGEAQLDASEDV
jgi:uncharacterized protein YjbJ (UPF0337 family)